MIVYRIYITSTTPRTTGWLSKTTSIPQTCGEGKFYTNKVILDRAVAYLNELSGVGEIWEYEVFTYNLVEV